MHESSVFHDIYSMDNLPYWGFELKPSSPVQSESLWTRKQQYTVEFEPAALEYLIENL